MVHASLFSGIGGFDLAAEWMGWENAFHCEINEWCAKVLQYHFPNSKHYADITKTDFREWNGKIDIITGGFPCQPFSIAGQRKGADDDRYLWPEMLRVIREIQPTWVIGENVAGIITMVQPGDEIEVECQTSLFEEADKETLHEQEFVIETVCRDLEHEGYSVQPIVIPACSVGAPHKRDRIWFVAHSNRNDARRCRYGEAGRTPGENQAEQEEREWLRSNIERISEKRITSYASGKRCFNRCNNWRKRPILHNRNRYASKSQSKRERRECWISQTRKAFTYSQRKGRRQIHKEVQPEQPNGYSLNGTCGKRNVTNACYQRLRRRFVLRSIKEKREESSNKQSCRFFCTVWENFPTQSPVCSGDDGLSARLDAASLLNGRKPRGNYNPFAHWRKESVKAYGNAIVPQVAYEIFKAIDHVCDLQIP